MQDVQFDLQKRAERLGERTFLGVPTLGFESGGREHFIYLLAAGLNPYSKVLDMGCGVLRVGYWLVHFLEPSCYCGIEPHSGRLAMGTQTILEPEILNSKRPRFDGNANFDASVFGEKFDFFLAYSIWTHACKQQICLTLRRAGGLSHELFARRRGAPGLPRRKMGRDESRVRRPAGCDPSQPRLDRGTMCGARPRRFGARSRQVAGPVLAGDQARRGWSGALQRRAAASRDFPLAVAVNWTSSLRRRALAREQSRVSASWIALRRGRTKHGPLGAQ